MHMWMCVSYSFLEPSLNAPNLYSSKNLCILVPGQQRILAAPRLRIAYIRPSLHEFLVAADERQFARDGAVEVFDDIEVGREEDVEVALVDLSQVSQYAKIWLCER
jgi:hypothetical protein